MQQGLGIDARVVGPADVAGLVPGATTDDVTVAAYEAGSGYADPYGTAAGFLAAARSNGARVVPGCRVDSVLVRGGRVAGVQTDRGPFGSPVVVDVAGAWSAELATTVGLEIPVQPWRHSTAFFGLPSGHGPAFPIVIDEINQVYFRPEGGEMMLVGLETGNELGGSPDRPLASLTPIELEEMVTRLCVRVPWMAGPDGFYLACGFSGTGFKTAPAVGACLAELILDGRTTTADISAYSLERFAEGRLLVGEHPYGQLWR